MDKHASRFQIETRDYCGYFNPLIIKDLLADTLPAPQRPVPSVPHQI